MNVPRDARRVTAEVWAGLDGPPEVLGRLTVTGPTHVLPSVFPVTAVATASVAAATLAAAQVWCRRGAAPSAVAVDSRHAALACRSERLLRTTDRQLGPIWDSLAGVYAAGDGWIRLHTNFRRHRLAACEVLGLGPDPSRIDHTAVAQAVSHWEAVALEAAIYEAGGCAGALRARATWRASSHAVALDAEPLVRIERVDEAGGVADGGDRRAASSGPDANGGERGAPSRPLQGLRVLDLSRVVAGPVAGRFLAAYGADVLRVDAPDGEDGAVTVADTTVGKRSALVDLRIDDGRTAFERLVAEADAIICGYRPGALAALGYPAERLAQIRPGLVVGTLSAYGGLGVGDPVWGNRRGFDSLVQMVTGIADEGRQATAAEAPVPLPAQLLDHASGYLLAAGMLTALARRFADSEGPDSPAREVSVSLARTAAWLDDLGRSGVVDMPDPPDELPEDLAVDLHGPLGHTCHIACPGVIVGAAPHWTSGPVPLGHDAPTW